MPTVNFANIPANLKSSAYDVAQATINTSSFTEFFGEYTIDKSAPQKAKADMRANGGSYGIAQAPLPMDKFDARMNAFDALNRPGFSGGSIA